MTSTEALEWLVELAHQDVSFGVNHDVDYGIDKRWGWSVSIYGHGVVEFAPTLEEAVAEAKRKYAEILADE